MTPPVFPVLSTSAAVRAQLGASPCRVYPFGLAPDGVVDPYCVWQDQGGAPEIYMGTRPDIDQWIVQFDVYGTSAESVEAAGKAIRDAIEIRYPVTAWLGTTRDPGTKRYRLTFMSSWWVNR